MPFNSPLLVLVMKNPAITADLNLTQWDLLIRQARRADVIARLAFLLKQQQRLAKIPEQPLAHLTSAMIYAEQFMLSVEWEVKCIVKALTKKDIPFVFLKGVAYILDKNRAAQGRIFSDVDILVAEADLPQAEMALMLEGWRIIPIDPYDQRYYRIWMHELPPMQHINRRTTLDVHHNILPKTCKTSPDARQLLANACTIAGDDAIQVFTPEYRVVHSATHLFNEGELDHGFRDLSDLDLLFKEFSPHAGFWQRLMTAAQELNQQQAIYYAIRYTHIIFDTPIPRDIIEISKYSIQGGVTVKAMDLLFLRALMPDHSSCNDRYTGVARWLLYIRSHWLRMPVHLLIPHLLHKSWIRIAGDSPH